MTKNGDQNESGDDQVLMAIEVAHLCVYHIQICCQV